MDYVKHISEITGHDFKNKSLLRAALTHSSYANEKDRHCTYNERLEFLGDSVLSLVVSEFLYTRKSLQRAKCQKQGQTLYVRNRLQSAQRK